MTTITIHYESPADDLFKIPRPHRVRIGDDGGVSEVEGGEIGPVGNLVGFCTTVTPNVDDWQVTLANDLYDGDVTAESLAGQYAQFTGVHGEMFGYGAQIKRVEVTA